MGSFVPENFAVPGVPQSPKNCEQNEWPELCTQACWGADIPDIFIREGTDIGKTKFSPNLRADGATEECVMSVFHHVGASLAIFIL